VYVKCNVPSRKELGLKEERRGKTKFPVKRGGLSMSCVLLIIKILLIRGNKKKIAKRTERKGESIIISGCIMGGGGFLSR
jgi:hypothetical protein